jgi:hypothetical protein
MLLIRAECEARRGNLDRALSDLNGLLSSRWTKERPYPDFITTDRENAITKILLERKKELCFRGIRWSDLRRLNQDPARQNTLKRTLNGQNYSLPPADPRYVFPIYQKEINGSGIEQNLTN